MYQPCLLDACCKAGGATRGYQRAGFRVVGVDIEPQPNYVGDEFIQADAFDVLADEAFMARFDAYHGSPPCQDHMRSPTHNQKKHGNAWMLPAMRDRFTETGKPWVIENVPGASMSPLVVLCGSSFGLGIPGYQLRRHRWFEISGGWFMSPPCQHRGPVIGIYGGHGRDRRRGADGGRYFTPEERMAAMGIDWMTQLELDQAIPPAYTEYIGEHLITALPAAA